MNITFHGTIDEIIKEMVGFMAYPAKPIPVKEQETTQTVQTTPAEITSKEPPEKKESAHEEVIASESSLIIPKFKWDTAAEKSFKSISFHEADEGKVMLFYTNSRVFTTKEKIMELPYPIPYGYPPLNCFNGNKKVAIRTYREYLATRGAGEPHQDRIETLKKAAKINKNRWGNGKKEMSPKTKELRDNIVMKMNLGVGAKP